MHGEIGGILKKSYGGFLKTGKIIVENEGIKGLFKGI